MWRGGIEAQLHPFLTSMLEGGERSTSRLCNFNPGKETGTNWIVGRRVPRAGMEVLENRSLFLLRAQAERCLDEQMSSASETIWHILGTAMTRTP